MCSWVHSAWSCLKNRRITRLSLSPIQRLIRSTRMLWCCWMKRAADWALAVREVRPRAAIARARGVRLPTEIEWELAATFDDAGGEKRIARWFGRSCA